MTEPNNILCDRKLEFGDIHQIEALKGIHNRMDDFLEYKFDILSCDGDIEDCIGCYWENKCEGYLSFKNDIKFYKIKGVW